MQFWFFFALHFSLWTTIVQKQETATMTGTRNNPERIAISSDNFVIVAGQGLKTKKNKKSFDWQRNKNIAELVGFTSWKELDLNWNRITTLHLLLVVYHAFIIRQPRIFATCPKLTRTSFLFLDSPFQVERWRTMMLEVAAKGVRWNRIELWRD